MTTPGDQAALAEQDLRDRRMELWHEFRAIADAAMRERAVLTPEETARCDELREEMSALDARIMMASPTGSFFDADNPLLAHVPVRLDTGTLMFGGEHPRGILTWRTASTTMTIVAEAADLRVWGKIITEMAGTLADRETALNGGKTR